MLLLTTSKKFWFSKLWLWNAWVCISLGFLGAHPASLSFAKVRMCWAHCSLPSSCFFMSQVSSSVRNQLGSKSLGFLVLPPTSGIFPTLAATVHSFFPLPTRCSFRSQLWFLILKSPFRSFYLPPYRGFSFPWLLARFWGLLWHLSGGCSLSHYVRWRHSDELGTLAGWCTFCCLGCSWFLTHDHQMKAQYTGDLWASGSS